MKVVVQKSHSKEWFFFGDDWFVVSVVSVGKDSQTETMDE